MIALGALRGINRDHFGGLGVPLDVHFGGLAVPLDVQLGVLGWLWTSSWGSGGTPGRVWRAVVSKGLTSRPILADFGAQRELKGCQHGAKSC